MFDEYLQFLPGFYVGSGRGHRRADEIVDRARDGTTSAIFSPVFCCPLHILRFLGVVLVSCVCEYFILCVWFAWGGCCFVFHDRVLARPRP